VPVAEEGNIEPEQLILAALADTKSRREKGRYDHVDPLDEDCGLGLRDLLENAFP
jgi:hypothetical protein